ncbi:MAG: phosphatidylglycerol lysyltransferase domain-containing protein [bacterium]
MLPEFPQFKTLELSDKGDVEVFTKKFPPYSDFNFVSMWSWDIKGEMRISQLNNNLVVRFTDYITGEPFYSFLGDNEVNDTVEKLLEISKKEGLKAELKLIPEEAIKNLDLKNYPTEEDPDHFDYIYKNENLANFNEKKFKNKRYLFKKFKTSYLDANTLITSSIDEKTKEDILKLDKKWANSRLEKTIDFDIKNETIAVEKFLSSLYNFSDPKFLFLCLYVGKELVGFSISSIINQDYVLCHFSKGDTKYIGVYEYMLKNLGENVTKITRFMNYEQDLGLSGLRFSKNSFRPSSFLKKYVIVKQ